MRRRHLDGVRGPLVANRLLDSSRAIRFRRDSRDADAHAGRGRDDRDAGDREAARLLLGLDVGHRPRGDRHANFCEDFVRRDRRLQQVDEEPIGS
jgi:hypothetical protein